MTTPATNRQVPDHSIFDHFNKQIYLGNGFILSESGLSLANTNETLVMLITNPAVTTLSFPNQKGLFCNLRRVSSSAQGLVQKVYINPTVSSTGTAATPRNLRPSSSNTSVSASYLNGQFTVSGNGTLYSAVGVGGANVEVNDDLMIVLDPGSSLLVTVTALAGTTVVNSEASWYEL